MNGWMGDVVPMQIKGDWKILIFLERDNICPLSGLKVDSGALIKNMKFNPNH